MPGQTSYSLLAVALLAAGCPRARSHRAADTWWLASVAQSTDAAETARLQRFARRLAIALADTGFRSRFDCALSLNRNAGVLLEPLLPAASGLIASIPVPAHRRAWLDRASRAVLVAVHASGLPVAFDLRGGRHRLDPTRPPQTPVILLGVVRPGSASALPAPPPRLPPAKAGVEGASRSRESPGTAFTQTGESP
jgi:hypothetical protein